MDRRSDPSSPDNPLNKGTRDLVGREHDLGVAAFKRCYHVILSFTPDSDDELIQTFMGCNLALPTPSVRLLKLLPKEGPTYDWLR
jgi:hypothetical protein